MFDEDELQSLKKIIDLFSDVKGVILYCEEIYTDKKTSPQILLELRGCLDHLLRAISAKLDIVNHDENYTQKNLDKSYGHLYRAGYDALDWAGLVLRLEIQKELDGFSHQTLSATLKDYYTDIKPDIVKISSEIAKLREKKDVGSPMENLKDMNKYLEMINRLKNYYEKIIHVKPSLIEIEAKENKHKQRELRNNVIINLIIALISVAIGVLLTLYFK